MAAGVLAFYSMREQGTAGGRVATMHDGNSLLPELEWLKRELRLTDEQFTKVAAVHKTYLPTCEALCMKVMASHAKIRSLITAGREMTPELEEALKEHALLHVECQKAMLQHLNQTAALMAPDQATRYWDALLPEVIGMPLEPGNRASAHP